jgi:hypothetical protein
MTCERTVGGSKQSERRVEAVEEPKATAAVRVRLSSTSDFQVVREGRFS